MAKELYVGHISDSATEEDIRKLFSVMGTVTSVHLIIDPDTREFKRCGYVRMAADINLDEVVETLDGAFLVDRIITVSIARPQKPGMSKKPGGFGKPGRFAPSDRPASFKKNEKPGALRSDKAAGKEKAAGSEKPERYGKGRTSGKPTPADKPGNKPGSSRRPGKDARSGKPRK